MLVNILFVILIAMMAAFYIFRKRFGILLILLFVFPTVIVTNPYWGERGSSGIQEMGLAIPLFSCIDILIELAGHNYGMIANQGNPYYHILFVVEIYSVFLLIFLSVCLRRYTGKGLRANFGLYAKKFYATPYFWAPMLVCGIGILLLTDYNANPTTSYHFSNRYLVYEMAYLIGYFVVLCLIMQKYFFLTAEQKFLALFMVLLFPVTGFSGEYNAVSNFGFEEYNLENHVALYPLLYSLPKTLLSLFTHFANEKFSIHKAAFAYSIIQSAAVLYLFPSLFNVNNEDNYRP